MNKFIITVSVLILEEGIKIGNGIACYNYVCYNDTGNLIWNACYVNAVVYLDKNKTGVNSENWTENIIKNCVDSSQGVNLIKQLIIKEFGEDSGATVEIHHEQYLYQNAKQLQNHIYLHKYPVDKYAIIKIPTGLGLSYKEQVVKYDISDLEIRGHLLSDLTFSK